MELFVRHIQGVSKKVLNFKSLSWNLNKEMVGWWLFSIYGLQKTRERHILGDGSRSGIEEWDWAGLVIGSLVGSRGLARGNNLGKLLHQQIVLEATLPSTDSTSIGIHHLPGEIQSEWGFHLHRRRSSWKAVLHACKLSPQFLPSEPPTITTISTIKLQGS